MITQQVGDPRIFFVGIIVIESSTRKVGRAIVGSTLHWLQFCIEMGDLQSHLLVRRRFLLEQVLLAGEQCNCGVTQGQVCVFLGELVA